MYNLTTRRDFVKLSAAGLAALAQAIPASAEFLSPREVQQTGQFPGSVIVQQTAGTKRFADEPELKWQPANSMTNLSWS